MFIGLVVKNNTTKYMRDRCGIEERYWRLFLNVDSAKRYLAKHSRVAVGQHTIKVYRYFYPPVRDMVKGQLHGAWARLLNPNVLMDNYDNVAFFGEEWTPESPVAGSPESLFESGRTYVKRLIKRRAKR